MVKKKAAKASDAGPKLIVRNAKLSDIAGIQKLTKEVYPDEMPYTRAMLRGQINNFPEGQFVAVYDERIVGYCATIILPEREALAPHKWHEITGGGYGSTHDATGDYLYGMEVCVDPAVRGLRIGRRLYNERKKLCQFLRLRGIVFGGRLPSLKRRRRLVRSAEDYVARVQAKEFRDTALSFQLQNGFEVLGLLKDYLPSDQASLGYAVHLVWHNPQIERSDQSPPQAASVTRDRQRRMSQIVRVGTVQYGQRGLTSFEEFQRYVEYFVDVVASYQADFAVFPELFTLQLLSIENQKLTPAQSIAALTKYTEPFKAFMRELAIKYNVNIIGGSHPTKTADGEIRNISYVFLREGSIHEQAKIHPTPNERYWWNIRGGNEISVIPTDCGNIGVLICYDSEFPELSRHLIDQGATILFVPFCTDERQSYLRVRYCAQARAVENQCYVVMSGNVGNLPGVENMDIQYAQSCILTPCDFPFARDGIAADTEPGVETVAFADLRLEDLHAARNSGTVQNLKDRRHDMYTVRFAH